MDRYIPPFTISNKMLEYVSSISEKVGGINSRHMLDNKPHLRKNNRIKSIHSSLRIEANSLSLSEVRDVINGKVVIGDRKEIQEVTDTWETLSKVVRLANEEDCQELYSGKVFFVSDIALARHKNNFRESSIVVYTKKDADGRPLIGVQRIRPETIAENPWIS